MRTFVAIRRMTTALPQSFSVSEITQLRKDFEELKLDIEDVLHDQNDINEDTRAQLEAISLALSELQTKDAAKPKRNPGQRIFPVGGAWLIKNKVVPLHHEPYPTASSHSPRCAYRQL